MKSLLKWTIVALRIFIEGNNQRGCVCLRSTLLSLPAASLQLPVFKEIISWRQDCERAGLWAQQLGRQDRDYRTTGKQPGRRGYRRCRGFVIATCVRAPQPKLKAHVHGEWIARWHYLSWPPRWVDHRVGDSFGDLISLNFIDPELPYCSTNQKLQK